MVGTVTADASQLRPIARANLASDVVSQIRETIIAGRFAPEERLGEERLAQLLGVSRGPVRQALDVLEREGLVNIKPHLGATVAKLSAHDLEEVYGVRLVIEQLAAAYASRRATSENLAELRLIVDQIRDAVANGITIQSAAALDLSFHDAIARAAGHSRLLDFWSMIRSQTFLFLVARNAASVDSRNGDFRVRIIQDHADLVAAIAARDERKAARLMDAHIRRSYRNIRANLPFGKDHAGEIPRLAVPAEPVLLEAGRSTDKDASRAIIGERL